MIARKLIVKSDRIERDLTLNLISQMEIRTWLSVRRQRPWHSLACLLSIGPQNSPSMLRRVLGLSRRNSSQSGGGPGAVLEPPVKPETAYQV